MYKYETHLHTRPASACAQFGVEENVEFYKSLGYDGIFITNHFPDGFRNQADKSNYKEVIETYFADYEAAARVGKKLGIKVFCGVETTYGGTDFLVYGLDKEWYLAHPEIMDMRKSEELPYLMENGALVIQAHPFREAGYIDHIRLFPRCVQGVEVLNGCRTDFENKMAKQYAEAYGLLETAGSDNHVAHKVGRLAGMCSDKPIADEKEFIELVKGGKLQIFSEERK